jgi:hypothetical protein
MEITKPGADGKLGEFTLKRQTHEKRVHTQEKTIDNTRNFYK